MCHSPRIQASLPDRFCNFDKARPVSARLVPPAVNAWSANCHIPGTQKSRKLTPSCSHHIDKNGSSPSIVCLDVSDLHDLDFALTHFQGWESFTWSPFLDGERCDVHLAAVVPEHEFTLVCVWVASRC